MMMILLRMESKQFIIRRHNPIITPVPPAPEWLITRFVFGIYENTRLMKIPSTLIHRLFERDSSSRVAQKLTFHSE